MLSVKMIDIMTIEFLANLEVREVLFELIWGDRFEKDLASRFDNRDTFYNIRDRLLEEDLIFRLFGENESPYISLTDKGIAVVNRLHEIERIMQGEDIDNE